MTVPAPAMKLLDFIAAYEAGPNDQYNVVYGHHEKNLPKPITSMTLAELITAQAQWGNEWGSSAAGRYQFMPTTLKSMIALNGFNASSLFSPELQDELGYVLLLRRGYGTKAISTTTFAKQLAEEWASLPVLADTQGAHRLITRGQSYYAGDGLNNALVTPEKVEAVLASLLAAPATPISPAAPIPVRQPNPLEKLQMNISILTLLFHYLPLLPFLQQDLAFEVKNIQSSADGASKLDQTIVVLEDVLAQVKAAKAGQTIPPSPQ